MADTPEDERRVSKAEKSAKKALDSKREKSRVKSGSAITNLIMLLFLLFLIHASALTMLSSPLDSPFSFDKPHFCPDLSSGEEPASLVDRKDTGETTAPISFLQEDQISQPSDTFDFEKSSDSCLFKVGSLREHVDFWSNSIRASDFIMALLLKATKFLSLICLRILLFPILDLRPSSLKILLTRPFQS